MKELLSKFESACQQYNPSSNQDQFDVALSILTEIGYKEVAKELQENEELSMALLDIVATYHPEVVEW